MPLVKCPDCGREVSDAAPACPQCGAPIASQTIEATAKKWKGLQSLGAVVILLGLGTCATAGSSDTQSGVAIILMIIGLAITLWAGIGAWWHHG